MYLKLALRNAKRSMADYLLYIFSMVVLSSIIYSSNFLANLGGIRAGFQTVSLPLIVVIVMAVLADWINTFIVKQRAKEFATYMLLGMEKDKLSLMFLCELCIVGMGCFLGGTALGMGLGFVCFYFWLGDGGIGSAAEIMAKSCIQSFGYFCLIEALSFFLMKQKIYKLQVIQLMREKRRSRLMREGRRHFWGVMFAACFLIFLLLLFGSSFMGEGIMSAAVSIIAIPMILCVFSFYQWVYALLASVRLSQGEVLYRGNWLYRIGEMTTGSGTGAGLCAVFGICLIFSAASFVFGMLLIGWDIPVFRQEDGWKWMGVLQIGICIIFMVVYFSILSLSQMIDLRRQKEDIRLLFQMGKSRGELKSLLRAQILVKLLLPTVMPFLILWTAAPFVNAKVNEVLPMAMQNLVVYAAGGFMLGFFGLYLCYFCMVYKISMRPGRK